MVIRIPDFMFAQSTGEATSPGELDYETRSALATARSTEKEMSSLNRALGLVSETLKGGDKVRERLAAARDALGVRGDSGAFRRLLDHVAAERARQEAAASHRTAMRTLVGTIKGVGSLPIPFAEKAELGRTLLQQGLERGLVALQDHRLFEDAAISQFSLTQAQAALAKSMESGEALAISEAAKAEGMLLPSDIDLLDRQARERDAVVTERHRGRLAWKEQDDLAAFARGELPEALGEDSFRLVHGAKGATGAYARYQAARKEGEALATIRGKDVDAIEAARAEWQGDPTVFAAAVAKDGADRRRDPAGYALATVVGAKAALDEMLEAERGALLWSAQAATGIPEEQRSPWTLKETQSLARRWLALATQPSGPARDDAMVTLLSETLLKLPPRQRLGAIAALEAQGLDVEMPGRLRTTLAALEDGSLGLAYLTVSGRGGKPRDERATMSGPRRAQQAQPGEMRPAVPQPSETGRIPLDDPALGAWTAEEFPEVFAHAAGTRIPNYKKLDQAVRRDWIPWQRDVRAFGAGEAQNFVLMEIFAAEGGLRPTGLGTVFGITPDILDQLGAEIGLDPTKLPSSEDLTNPQRLALFKAYLDERDGGLGRAGGYEALETIGDKQVAAAIADVYWRDGGRGNTIAYVLHGTINDVLRSEAALAQRLFQLLQANGELSSSQVSLDPEAFQLVADGKFGKQSLRAVQLIVQDEAARRLLLDGIAERRIQWHLDHPQRYAGDPTYDIERRYPHFRFQ
jgi:hypothetical protein